jgi:hypothetical protein
MRAGATHYTGVACPTPPLNRHSLLFTFGNMWSCSVHVPHCLCWWCVRVCVQEQRATTRAFMQDEGLANKRLENALVGG